MIKSKIKDLKKGSKFIFNDCLYTVLKPYRHESYKCYLPLIAWNNNLIRNEEIWNTDLEIEIINPH